MSASILIIGAGIAGLATGCYAQMNGFSTEIFEMHDKPGGLCTAWKRGGYTFDYCIHNLAGTAPRSPYHRMWRELGALQPQAGVRHGIEAGAGAGDEDCAGVGDDDGDEAGVEAGAEVGATAGRAGDVSKSGGGATGPRSQAREAPAGCAVYRFKEMVRVEEPSGKSLVILPDIARLEDALRRMAPHDADVISDCILVSTSTCWRGSPVGITAGQSAVPWPSLAP